MWREHSGVSQHRQTVSHAHVHDIPRYNGDTPDPRGVSDECDRQGKVLGVMYAEHAVTRYGCVSLRKMSQLTSCTPSSRC